MTRLIETFSATRTVKVAVELQFQALADGLYVFRQSISSTGGKTAPGSTMTAPRTASPKGHLSGFVDEVGRKQLLAGKSPKLLDLRFLPDALLESARTRGWSAAEHEIYAQFQQDAWQRLVDDPSLSADNLVSVDVSSHMLFDRHGVALPVGVYFDYITNHIDESSYDLPKVIEALLRCPDIVVFEVGRRKRAPTTDARKALFSIPHYNADEGHTQSMEFLWMPTKETYARVWGACSGEYRSVRLRDKFLELDLAGIAQFRREKVGDD